MTEIRNVEKRVLHKVTLPIDLKVYNVNVLMQGSSISIVNASKISQSSAEPWIKLPLDLNRPDIDGAVQESSVYIAITLKMLQSCIKTWIYKAYDSDITWTSWQLKSLTTWMFVQNLLQANNKETSNGLVDGYPPLTGRFPAQRDNNVLESIFMSWCFNGISCSQMKAGLVQDCSNSIANALELLQCCTKLSILW